MEIATKPDLVGGHPGYVIDLPIGKWYGLVILGRGRNKGASGRAGSSGTRERVMDVAEARLAEVGYLGVSLEEVAREVGVSKPALYYHFPGGKEELFVEIAHRALRITRENLERAMSGPEDGAGRLHAAARWLMDEHDRGRPMGELRDLVKFVAEEHHAGLAEGFYGALFGPIRRTIASAVESGEFRGEFDPDFLTWSFLGLALGMMDVGNVQTGPPGPDSPQTPTVPGGEGMADRMVDLFLDGALK